MLHSDAGEFGDLFFELVNLLPYSHCCTGIASAVVFVLSELQGEGQLLGRNPGLS